MKVKLTCQCGESFNIDANNFKDKTTIICQNCDSKFPEDKFQDFKDSIIKLNDIHESLNEITDGYRKPHWTFEFE
ncbi:hypothetical protein [Clostridium kluyveri]|nr:hypothetical protein [Clostridium kluyveri]